MKKMTAAILCTALAATVLPGMQVTAQPPSVWLDGKEIEFDVCPEIADGRVMVPLRGIFEEIGALVKWDGETKTVSARKSSKTVTLSVGSSELTIDKGDTDDAGNPISEKVELDASAQIISGRTLVPVRAISESFGLNVDWDEADMRVVITSEKDDDKSLKENVGTINLTDMTYVGNGIEIADNRINITAGGDFTVSGTLSDGGITVSTKDKVKLRLNGAYITSSGEPCIFIESADKAYITVSEGSENVLCANNCELGAIYSKDNLEIKGGGTLFVTADAGHGIKASDNLTIENGKINIEAEGDGIHVNDTFKMSGGNVNITAIGDGIDSESIVNISGGVINIETNAAPIEKEETAEEVAHGGMPGAEEADVEFEKSSKGINAEWMIYVSGGEININSASHAIHCGDEIQIDGGAFTLSSKYEKGISAHGNLTVNNSETVIDVTKSTEGVESKNIMTINDGVIKVVATDDALNATGGNSGDMMPGGEGFGGGRGDFAKGESDKNDKNGAQGRRGQDTENFGELKPKSGEADGNRPAPPFENAERTEFAPPPENRPTESEMRERENQGGFGRNLKDCLVINGGSFELYAGDDCIDSNGNIIINGGTVNATNPTGSFSGNFAVLDADGTITIGEDANIIFAANRGSERNLKTAQNRITIYCENQHTEGERISVTDSGGNVLYEYTPKGSFKSVMIASKSIKIGEKYSIKIGDEAFETEITEQSTALGIQQGGGTEFNRGTGAR